MSSSIEETIEALRLCNTAQAEVIMNLEEYQLAIAGARPSVPESEGGYGNGYVAEIDYLTFRRNALETLIASVERYGHVSTEATPLDAESNQSVNRAA